MELGVYKSKCPFENSVTTSAARFPAAPWLPHQPRPRALCHLHEALVFASALAERCLYLGGLRDVEYMLKIKQRIPVKHGKLNLLCNKGNKRELVVSRGCHKANQWYTYICIM